MRLPAILFCICYYARKIDLIWHRTRVIIGLKQKRKTLSPAHQPNIKVEALIDVVRIAVAEIDDPRIATIVSTRRGRPKQIALRIGEISRVNRWRSRC